MSKHSKWTKALAMAPVIVTDRERYCDLFHELIEQCIEQYEEWIAANGRPWLGGIAVSNLRQQAIDNHFPVRDEEWLSEFCLALGFNIRVEGDTRPRHFVLIPKKGKGGETIKLEPVSVGVEKPFTVEAPKPKPVPKAVPPAKTPAKAPAKPAPKPPEPPAKRGPGRPPKGGAPQASKPNGGASSKPQGVVPIPQVPKSAATVLAETEKLRQSLWAQLGPAGQRVWAKYYNGKKAPVVTKDIIHAAAGFYVAGVSGIKPRRRPDNDFENEMLSAGAEDQAIKVMADKAARGAKTPPAKPVHQASQLSGQEGKRPTMSKAAPRRGRKIVRRK